jgi:hypothetical protein
MPWHSTSAPCPGAGPAALPFGAFNAKIKPLRSRGPRGCAAVSETVDRRHKSRAPKAASTRDDPGIPARPINVVIGSVHTSIARRSSNAVPPRSRKSAITQPNTTMS